MEKHGSLPEGIEEPPSLLDESIKIRLAKQLFDWRNRPEPKYEGKPRLPGNERYEGGPRYPGTERYFPAGMQEGGEISDFERRAWSWPDEYEWDENNNPLRLKNPGSHSTSGYTGEMDAKILGSRVDDPRAHIEEGLYHLDPEMLAYHNKARKHRSPGRFGFQEGGMAYPDTDTGYKRPLDDLRKYKLGDSFSDDLSSKIEANINPSTGDNVTDIRDIVTNIDSYNKTIDPMMELRSISSPKNLLRSEKDKKVERLMGQMGFQEGGYVQDARRPKRNRFGF